MEKLTKCSHPPNTPIKRRTINTEKSVAQARNFYFISLELYLYYCLNLEVAGCAFHIILLRFCNCRVSPFNDDDVVHAVDVVALDWYF